MENTLVIAGLVIPLGLAFLGWAYSLGFMGARTQQNEKNITELRERLDRHEKDFREEIKNSFNKVYKKIDELPCHNPRWKMENCQ